MARVLGPDFAALHVRDLPAARRFYTDRLGLVIDPDFTTPDFVTFATRPIPFAIRQAAPGDDPATPGVNLWLGCDDADGLHAALAAAGVPILRGPEDTRFGRRFICQDPDGHALIVYTAIPLDRLRPSP